MNRSSFSIIIIVYSISSKFEPNLYPSQFSITPQPTIHGMGRQSGQIARGAAGSVTTTPVKPLKILKRPSDAAVTPTPKPALPILPKSPAERATAEISAAVEAALLRERERLEKQYLAREQAIVRALGSLLSDTLPAIVDAAATREASKLAEAFSKLPQYQKRPPVSPANVRAAFAGAFATNVLPAMEQCTRELLSGLAAKVDTAVEEKVAKPARDGASSVATAAQAIAAAQYAVKDAIAMRTEVIVDPNAEVRALVEAGRWAEAIVAGMKVGEEGIRIGVEGAIYGDGDIGMVLTEANLNAVEMVSVIQVAVGKLEDETKARLDWLYEVLSAMDDLGAVVDESQKPMCRQALEFAIDKLRTFAGRKDIVSAAMAKHIKLMVHILNAHVSTM